jgi:hypothetical protein
MSVTDTVVEIININYIVFNDVDIEQIRCELI